VVLKREEFFSREEFMILGEEFLLYRKLIKFVRKFVRKSGSLLGSFNADALQMVFDC